MAQRDYLLRQIEQLGVALARIRELILGGEPVLAKAGLQQVAAQSGVDLEVLQVLAPESLLQLLMGAGEGNLEKLIPAAEVLFLKGELEEYLGQTGRSAQSFAKASLLGNQVRALIGEVADSNLKSRVEELLEDIERRRSSGHSSDASSRPETM
ncbi:MAG: hypothetical protein JSV86_04355 [Gemmatimonadota bacterium]|nr:MAG: hypothetical protein JSV86_04355 [Gemmatimonadota bacterium]